MGVKQLYNSNESILNGILSSDDRVLDHLYKEYSPMISNMVMLNSGTFDDARDIFQEGIIVIYEKVKNKQLELTCSIKTYLYSVCRNLWLKALKKKSIYVSFNDTYNEMVTISDEQDEHDTLNQQQQILTELINTIGESCKQILTLFYYEKLSMNDIAGKLGYTNAGNAKTQKYKCFKRLQKLALEKFKKENLIDL